MTKVPFWFDYVANALLQDLHKSQLVDHKVDYGKSPFVKTLYLASYLRLREPFLRLVNRRPDLAYRFCRRGRGYIHLLTLRSQIKVSST